MILSNGKIITVDARFSIAQAVAIKGERILAVGTNQDINRLAGPATRRIDLRGRSVVPGLIDNHAHYMEEGVLWTVELRLDNVDTRKQALEMIRAKANSLKPGALGVHARRLVARSVHRRQAAHSRRTSSIKARQQRILCCSSSRAPRPT